MGQRSLRLFGVGYVEPYRLGRAALGATAAATSWARSICLWAWT
jgi:hypothetical protein